jgi:hypothetical protein
MACIADDVVDRRQVLAIGRAAGRFELRDSSCQRVYMSWPMANTLRSTIDALANTFAASVVAAIRGASLQDILAVSPTSAGDAPRRGPGRPRGTTAKSAPAARPAAAPATARRAKGRLARRSAADIAKALGQVVALVKSKKDGLRSEQIRAALHMDAKEMPRVLKEGLTKKVLKSKGQKRSTAYTAA